MTQHLTPARQLFPVGRTQVLGYLVNIFYFGVMTDNMTTSKDMFVFRSGTVNLN